MLTIKVNVMSTTVKINEECTQCEACLDKITLYKKEWTDAIEAAKPTTFSIGSDGYAEFEQARDECPVEAIEEFG